MTTTTNGMPISVGDRVRRADQRTDRGFGQAIRLKSEQRDGERVVTVLVCYADEGGRYGLDRRNCYWIAASALIRVGGAREALNA